MPNEGPLLRAWAKDCSGSKPPVQVMGKQSVAQHQRGRGSPMTAVPHTGTGAIRASAPVPVPNSRFAAVSVSTPGSTHRQQSLQNILSPA